MLENETKVLIVGAGPAGLTMACFLILQHIKFRIIDKSSDFSNYSGALILHAGTLELFRQLGIAEKAIQQGKILKAIHFSFSGTNNHTLEISHAGDKLSEYPYALLLEQGKTERILAEFIEQHGVSIERETTLTDFSEYSDHVENHLNCTQTEETLNTDYLVAADGGHSFIRSKLEIPLSGITHTRSLFAMDCTALLDLPSDEALISLTSSATTGFFPLSQGKWRIDGAFRWHEKNPSVSFLDVQQNFSRKTLQKVNILSSSWFAPFHSHKMNAVFYNTERCFLVGDSAHLYSPVGSQGMNHGIQDAANLSWKLAYAIKKWAKPCILLSYETERKQVSEKTAWVSDKLFEFLSSDQFFMKFMRVHLLPLLFSILKRIFNIPLVKRYLFVKISGVGIPYKNSNIITTDLLISRGPKAGNRMPYGIYDEAGRSVNITREISPVCMQLFVFCPNGKPDDFLEKIERFKMQVEWHVLDYNEETRSLFNQFKIKKTTFYLVRPDMYIACRGNDPQKLEKYLYHLLIPDLI